MNAPDRTLTVALLAVPDAAASTLLSLYDVFSSVGRDWEVLIEGRPPRPRMRPIIVAESSGRLSVANGIYLDAECGFDQCTRPDIVCVPDLLISPATFARGQHPAAIQWLTACHASGSLITSACSGALLLAEAGLLDGQEATIHWAYGDTMRLHFPEVRLRANQTLVSSGIGQRVVTAGGGASWQDLALFLIAREAGLDQAMHIAKLYLFEWHDRGQTPYAALVRSARSEDGLVSEAQSWLANNFDRPHPVSSVIARSGLPERTFKRRFVQAAGMSAMEYVHTLRLEAAKQRLETSQEIVESIAESVGYEDASFFRRLFRRKVGMTPAEYRRRFSGLRSAVTDSSHSGS
ncbi:GlxA family transcriptional regulator [Azoarcus taiwanensis]|uniref:Helix-turn-helix domain-containing protein n=1 Tax=Azoarcus taiwanensis TaxID=666964 RepID=A0A972F8T3_9RHOO|nr:helix-turn-helix domain-containing protein [Azoarcus taiwanensis]NMG02054.1 helix-turn-helix domain-containing protein [Azoarcus taiwanensis]